jgi:hypothetical protein
MKILHQVWKQLIWVWNEFQGYEKSAWRCEKYDKCYETNTPLKSGTKIVSMVRNRSIRGVQIEAHSTFFTTKNESKFVLLTTIFTTNGLVSYYWNYFCTRLDLFRTIETIFVPVWYKNSFNCTKQIHSCVSLFSWCTTWNTQYIFHNQKWVKICIVCHWLHTTNGPVSYYWNFFCTRIRQYSAFHIPGSQTSQQGLIHVHILSNSARDSKDPALQVAESRGCWTGDKQVALSCGLARRTAPLSCGCPCVATCRVALCTEHQWTLRRRKVSLETQIETPPLRWPWSLASAKCPRSEVRVTAEAP